MHQENAYETSSSFIPRAFIILQSSPSPVSLMYEKERILAERKSGSDTPATSCRALAGYGSQYTHLVERNTAIDGALRRCNGAFPVGPAGLSHSREVVQVSRCQQQ